MTQDIQLSSIFKEVTKVLKANRQELNDADEYNHNHGSNMVKTFSLLQKLFKASRTNQLPSNLTMPAKPCVIRAQVALLSCMLMACASFT